MSDNPPINSKNTTQQIDYTSMTVIQLKALCKERNITRFSGKPKSELITLLGQQSIIPILNQNQSVAELAITTTTKPTRKPRAVDGVGTTQQQSNKQDIIRLNYIGSKYQLIDWLTTNILAKTGWQSFTGKRVADLFAGTGYISYYFRAAGASAVITNDAELYSSVIAHAFTKSVYNPRCSGLIQKWQLALGVGGHIPEYGVQPGYITRNYSPSHSGCERKFFTVDNAQRIDYLRAELERERPNLSEDDYKFLLASIVISADQVSNVPAVYGCYLKNFKAKATKPLVLLPIHKITEPRCTASSQAFNSDVLNLDFLRGFETDMVYLDPPYNERQYSKNYFPLNIICKPDSALSGVALKGITGIPSDCFISPFCKKGHTVESAFETLFRELKTQWIFLSYNSESLVSKERMLEIMGKYGQASVITRPYKRFKSFEYNQDVDIEEYLFCLEKNNSPSQQSNSAIATTNS
jgi:adenine-specific DNA-methyltransferase